MKSDDTPTVTCVIPTHNRWQLLQRAVRSALAQEAVSVEVIVVDDGSDDETPHRYRDLGHVKYLRLEGVGPAASRNLGAQAATCHWIAFLDDDDEWFPHKLRTQWEFARRHGVRICCTGHETIHQDGRKEASPGGGTPVRLPSQLLEGNFMATSSVLLARDLFHASGGFDPSLPTAEDWDLWLRLAEHSGVGFCSEVLVRQYRSRSDNLTSRRERLLLDSLRVQRAHLRRWTASGRVPLSSRTRVHRAHCDLLLQLASEAWRDGRPHRGLTRTLHGLLWHPCYTARHLAAQSLGSIWGRAGAHAGVIDPLTRQAKGDDAPGASY